MHASLEILSASHADLDHVIVQGRPHRVVPGPALAVGHTRLATWTIPAGVVSPPLGASFEDAQLALERLPRMWFEPDGSFVWTGDQERPWQLDGLFADRQGRLVYLELKGHCPAAQLDQLLQACGWPAAPLIFQLVRPALFVDEATFRKIWPVPLQA